jgi:hypothetical protein
MSDTPRWAQSMVMKTGREGWYKEKSELLSDGVFDIDELRLWL